MFTNCSESEKFCAKKVPVLLKDAYSDQLRTVYLDFTMEWQVASTGLCGSKVLATTLTDSNDPFFLYNLNVSEEEFQELKSTQKLRTDFASFPQYIVDYCEKSIQEENNAQPRFSILLNINDKFGSVAPELQINETINFKHLDHLILKFVPASETAMRKYLISSFRNLKDEKSQLQNKVAFLNQDIASKTATYEQRLNSYSQELESLKKQSNADLTIKDSKYVQELQEERNRFQKKSKETQDRFEAEMKEKEQLLHMQISQLETKISTFDRLNKDLQAKNKRHESSIREQKATIESLTDEVIRLRDSSQVLNQKCDALSFELKSKESFIQQQQKKIHDLDRDLQNKRQRLTKQKEQIEMECKKREHMTEELEDVKVKCQMHEQRIQCMYQDKDKQDEVIDILQLRVEELKGKIKDGRERCSKLEQENKEKSKHVDKLQDKINELQILVEGKEYELGKFNGIFHNHKRKIKDLEEEVHRLNNVIKYMNRQMLEHNIQYKPSSEESPTAVAMKQLHAFESRKSLSNPDNRPVDSSPSTIPMRNLTLSRRKSTSNCHQTPDSAYSTDPSGYTDQFTPDNNPRNSNTEFNAEEQQKNAAISDIFGDNTPKTSTAKKNTDHSKRQFQKPAPLKSSVSKISKKR